MKIVGIILLAGGLIALATGGFSYTKETHKADIGPVHIAVEDKQDVNVPLWAGIAAVVAGVALLVIPKK
ncbi:MAG TPA: hypothetical protein VKR38_15805 [Usitatibacter sp.]|nr:hypothetical protein [Usitatibacter sp.]